VFMSHVLTKTVVQLEASFAEAMTTEEDSPFVKDAKVRLCIVVVWSNASRKRTIKAESARIRRGGSWSSRTCRLKLLREVFVCAELSVFLPFLRSKSEGELSDYDKLLC